MVHWATGIRIFGKYGNTIQTQQGGEDRDPANEQATCQNVDATPYSITHAPRRRRQSANASCNRRRLLTQCINKSTNRDIIIDKPGIKPINSEQIIE